MSFVDEYCYFLPMLGGGGCILKTPGFFFFLKLFFDNLIFKGRLSAVTFSFPAQKGNTGIAIHFPTRRVEQYGLLKG